MPTCLPKENIPKWMHDFAQLVPPLVSEPERLRYFRDQIDEWHVRCLARLFEKKNWNDRRKQHVTDGQASDRLRDWKAGPPPDHPDWICEYCPEINDSVWMPRKYAIGNEPDDSPPLPFKDHESTLWEEYAILAALHDQVCRNVILIVPKQDSQSDTSRGLSFEVAWRDLCERIKSLTERDHPALEKCLADVCADLKVPMPAAAEVVIPAVQGPQVLEQTFVQVNETTNINVLLPSDATGTTDDKIDSDDPPDEYIFRPDGDGWDLKYETERGHFGDAKGLQRICELLKTPNTPIAGLTLCDGDSRCKTLTHSNAESFDQQAFADYNRKLKEYDEGIEDARKNSDDAELDRCSEEKEKLLAQMKRDTRLGGGPRVLGERSSAKSALRAAKESIRGVRKKLRTAELTSMADHLEQHIKTEESSLVYRPPSPAPSWTF